MRNQFIPPGDDKYEIRVTELVVIPPGKQIFAEEGTTIKLVNEAAGEFIEIHQYVEHETKIRIDPQEWLVVQRAVQHLVDSCREYP